MPNYIKVRQSDGLVVGSGAQFGSTLIYSSAINRKGTAQSDFNPYLGTSKVVNMIAFANEDISVEGTIWKLDSSGNKIVWGYNTGASIYGVHYSNYDDKLYATGIRTNTWTGSGGQMASIWVLSKDSNGSNGPAIGNVEKTFDIPSDTGGINIHVDNLGNMYVLGNSNSNASKKLYKLDKNGVVVWTIHTQGIETTGFQTLYGSNSGDQVTIALYGATITRWSGPGGTVTKDADLLVIDENGLIKWTYFVGNDSVSFSEGNIDCFIDENTKEVFVGGVENVNWSGGDGSTKASLWKFSPIGNLEWAYNTKNAIAKSYQVTSSVRVNSIYTDKDQNVYATTMQTLSGSVPHTTLLKLNKNGELLGIIPFGFINNVLHNKIVVDPVVNSDQSVWYFGVAGRSLPQNINNVDEESLPSSSSSAGGSESTSTTVNCGDGDIDCSQGENFHFILYFYSDPDFLNLVTTVDSRTEWSNFTVNGTQMTSSGAFVCSNENVKIKFNLPNDDIREELFNQTLYAKVSNPIINFDASPTDKYITTIIVLDQSFIKTDDYDWLIKILEEYDEYLVSFGLGPNKYGLVGFGLDEEYSVDGYLIHQINEDTSDEDYPLGDINNIVNFLNNPANIIIGGKRGDSYSAINSAYQELPLKANPISTILITDEDREEVADISFSDIKNLFDSTNTTFSLIAPADFVAKSGKKAMAMNGLAYAVVESLPEECDEVNKDKDITISTLRMDLPSDGILGVVANNCNFIVEDKASYVGDGSVIVGDILISSSSSRSSSSISSSRSLSSSSADSSSSSRSSSKSSESSESSESSSASSESSSSSSASSDSSSSSNSSSSNSSSSSRSSESSSSSSIKSSSSSSSSSSNSSSSSSSRSSSSPSSSSMSRSSSTSSSSSSSSVVSSFSSSSSSIKSSESSSSSKNSNYSSSSSSSVESSFSSSSSSSIKSSISSSSSSSSVNSNYSSSSSIESSFKSSSSSSVASDSSASSSSSRSSRSSSSSSLSSSTSSSSSENSSSSSENSSSSSSENSSSSSSENSSSSSSIESNSSNSSSSSSKDSNFSSNSSSSSAESASSTSSATIE